MNSAQFGDPEARRIRLLRAVRAGVCAILVPATEPDHAYAFCMQIEALEAEIPGLQLHVAAGIHPWSLAKMDDRAVSAALDRLKSVLEHRPARLCAVGECGLDHACGVAPDRQRRVFEAQAALAAAHGLPLVLHCVKAHDELLGVLDAVSAPSSVLHGFTGSEQLGRRYWTRGHLLGFGGALTRRNVRRVVGAAREIPRDQMLIETDSPDQTPWKRRPGPNEPAFLVDVAQSLAEIRGVAIEEIASDTAANARRVFGLQDSDGGPA